MKPPIYITISGAQGAGKSTVLELIREALSESERFVSIDTSDGLVMSREVFVPQAKQEFGEVHITTVRTKE